MAKSYLLEKLLGTDADFEEMSCTIVRSMPYLL